ncbi:type IV secretory system conjugative DNA transfer family protein [Francisella sp. 19X1-34]|uniref:type IV secretory system conjugative DNA transfer family protein n=1 Tax=Francisella sp. 19X1-34 TaxID=3087177 RepID=UPI002E30717E|nr:type IV secretory system conjugative DNA transfer family protein [Francisella sp. 19X1-34]MED7789639.1 type IV secretory system conjugative DNA transfer family protein [Francisella sp. 19X1-34]
MCNIGIDVDPNMYSSSLAQAIALEDPSGGRNKSFYDDARSIIAGILFYLVNNNRNIYELFEIVVKKGLNHGHKLLARYNKSLDEDNEIILIAIKKIEVLFEKGSLTVYGQGVYGNIISAVEIFGRPDIKAIFTKGDPERTLDVKEFLEGKADIYMIVPTSMVEQTASFIKFMIGVAKSAIEFARPQMLLAEYYIFALDEIAQLSCMKLIEKMYEVLQYKKTRFWLYFQNMNQLQKFSMPDMIKEFDVLQFFEVNGDKTIEFIKNLSGSKTVEVESVGERQKDKDKSTNTSLTRTELLPIDKIRELPADKQIIFHKGCPVILCDRTKYYEHRRYKGLAAENLTRTDDKDIQALIPADNEEVRSKILAERKESLKQQADNSPIKHKNYIKKVLLSLLKQEKNSSLLHFQKLDEYFYLSEATLNNIIATKLTSDREVDDYIKLLMQEEFLIAEETNGEILFRINT